MLRLDDPSELPDREGLTLVVLTRYLPGGTDITELKQADVTWQRTRSLRQAGAFSQQEAMRIS